jgi:tetratricopeptide (TPR) repeat protein
MFPDKLCGCLAAALILAGFPSGARGAGPGLPGTSSLSRPVPAGEQPAAPLTPAATPDEARRALESREPKLPQAGEARPAALLELARFGFIGGLDGSKPERQKFRKKGRYYAEILIKEQPRRVEGYYWLALNLGGLAEIAGVREGLRLVPPMMENLQTALKLNETYDAAGPHRVLGRIYFEAPGWPLSVGNINKSLDHLRAAVRLAPENCTNHLYLAETLLRLGKREEGRQELERVLTAPHHALSPRDLVADRRDAQALLKKYKSTGP